MNGAAVIQPAPIPFYTVLVLYLGIMAFIGWYAGRKTNNIGDFFVLSGKAGVVVSGIAYFSTQFSMGTFLGTPGTIYGVGYAGMAELLLLHSFTCPPHHKCDILFSSYTCGNK